MCPIGFDALNLIFEQLWFEEDNQRTKKNIIKELNLMIKYLRERNVLDPIFFENPLEKMTQFIKNNLKFWNKQEKKLPVLKFSYEEINIIDKIISNLK